MSSQGDFDDFDFDKPNPNANMEDILDKVDKFSIDWDNFDAPNNDKSHTHSNVSDIFNKSKKSQSQKSEKLNFEDSRDIMQISMIASQNQQGSFRFEKEDERNYPVKNERYNRLQNLLETAKKNSLDQFYKNIDQQNKAYFEEPQKFANYPQFKQYVKELKKQKKEKQSSAPQRQSFNTSSNPFGPSQSNISNPFNTQYSKNNINQIYGSQNSNQNNKYNSPVEPKIEQSQKQYNFSKKKSNENINMYGSSSNSNNFLPNEFENEDYFVKEEPYQQKKTVLNYNNFYEGEKLPEKAPQHNKDEDAFDFFQIRDRNQSKKQKDKKINLQPIREQKHNSFQKTFQEEKIQNLFKNYQHMRKNFEQLMGQLKSTNQNQEKIVTEIRKLKDQKHEKDVKEHQKERQERKEKDKVQKNQKLDEIKEEINKIKYSDKDILYSQINKKIESLESVVRLALEQINEEKQTKIIPKVTNYFCEHDKNIINQYENAQPQQSNRSYSNQSHEQSKQIFTQNIENIQSKQNLEQSPSQQSRSLKQSKAKSRSPIENSRKSLQSGSRAQNLFSPLDIPLQNNYSRDYSQQMGQQDFSPEEFACEHFARQFQGQNKNLRNSLLQKSSVVFESFDFHVSARFSIVDDPIHPIVAAMRVGNKCSIDLYDVHAIIYGPQGPGISTDPATIFQQQLKKSTSLAFQVSVDKSCLEDNGFSIQISYKTDSMSKKKINFKVPLPLVPLIRPEFIYEEKFLNDWYSLKNQLYLRPKRLDSTYLRSHEDLKLIIPFIELSQEDPDSFSYGLTFRYPKSENLFYLKVTCYVSGKASVQIRSQRQGDRKLKQQILNVFNFILFSP